MRRYTESGAECRGELLLRARRGVVTDSERLALSAHLSTCEACQQLAELVRDFEAVGGAAAGDSALLSRISERTLDSVRPASRLPRVRVYWFAAASVALLAGIAGATLLGRTAPKSQSPQPSLAVLAPSEPGNSTKARSLPPLDVASARAPSEASSVGRGLDPSAPPSRMLTRPTDSASKIFREANESRRAGDSSRAVSLYRDLQRRFPDAAETNISRVSLGSVLLDTGAAPAALQQFDSYLASPRGALAAEATYGRGRALMSLHRSSDETATWQGLLDQFPRSPYASYAKRRLDELH
jgi:TolA-binding protein